MNTEEVDMITIRKVYFAFGCFALLAFISAIPSTVMLSFEAENELNAKKAATAIIRITPEIIEVIIIALFSCFISVYS